MKSSIIKVAAGIALITVAAAFIKSRSYKREEDASYDCTENDEEDETEEVDEAVDEAEEINESEISAKCNDVGDKPSFAFADEVNLYLNQGNPKRNLFFGTSNDTDIGISDNASVAVFGDSGSGKSYSYIGTNLLRGDCSAIVIDPSGGLATSLGEQLIHKGFLVKVMDTSDSRISDAVDYCEVLRSQKSVLFLTSTVYPSASFGSYITGIARKIRLEGEECLTKKHINIFLDEWKNGGGWDGSDKVDSVSNQNLLDLRTDCDAYNISVSYVSQDEFGEVWSDEYNFDEEDFETFFPYAEAKIKRATYDLAYRDAVVFMYTNSDVNLAVLHEFTGFPVSYLKQKFGEGNIFVCLKNKHIWWCKPLDPKGDMIDE